MDPVLDGTGGGFGKHPGLPVREVLARFEQAVAEGKMRSVRTVIRIAREQIEARGDLDVYPRLMTGALVVAANILILGPRLPESLRESALPAAAAFAGVGLVVGFGVWQSRDARVANRAQVRLIRQGALDALRRLAESPDLKREPLDWSDQNALNKLRKGQKLPEWS